MATNNELGPIGEVVGGVAALAAFIYVAIVQPRSNDARARRVDRKVMRLFERGTPGMKGMYEKIASGPERVAANEQAIKSNTGRINHHDVEIGKLNRGMANLTREVVESRRENRQMMADLLARLVPVKGD